MTLSLVQALLFATVCLPLAVVAANWTRVVSSPRLAALAGCALVYAVDELLVLRFGQPYYFYHVVISGLLVCVCAAVVVMIERPTSPLNALYGFAILAGLVLTVSAALAFRYPAHVAAIGASCALCVLLMAVVLLIRAIDDRAVTFISIAAWWAFRTISLYQQWDWVNALLSECLFAMIAGVVVVHADELRTVWFRNATS